MLYTSVEVSGVSSGRQGIYLYISNYRCFEYDAVQIGIYVPIYTVEYPRILDYLPEPL
jgi:hypothetical protein